MNVIYTGRYPMALQHIHSIYHLTLQLLNHLNRLAQEASRATLLSIFAVCILQAFFTPEILPGSYFNTV